MSNPVTKVEIKRRIDNGVWWTIEIRFKKLNGRYTEVEKWNETNGDEDFAVSILLQAFLPRYSIHFVDADLDELKSDIVEGFRQLRENDSQEYMVIDVVPEKLIRIHSSCSYEDSTPQPLKNNEISQSELQQKLVNLDKDSRNMKFFEENQCSVCLGTYKNILDDNLHIVVPSCGHPLCCGCADNILKSAKKECPRCRGNITADSFNLMKFNADLEMEIQDHEVFL